MAETAPHEEAPRRPAKSAAAFRTISEVAGELDVPAHVLRFWESKFNQIRPLKRGGGRRYYRPEDISLLRDIRELLYTDGYTIKGVQKLLREGGGKRLARSGARTGTASRPVDIVAEAGADQRQARPPAAASAASGAKQDLRGILRELEAARDLLRRPLD